MNETLPATSLQLLQTAERLFALDGIDAVSTRRIAQEAHQRNVSALQYHFGSKDNLIDALLAMRLETINARRQQMLDALSDTPDLHGLLMALALPLIEQLETPDSHFVGCLYQLYLRARGERVYSNQRRELTAALNAVTAHIERHMTGIPPAIRRARLRLMGSQLIHSAGEWYYQRERGEPLAPVAELATALADFLGGGLLAAVSPPPRGATSRRRTPR